MTLYKQLKNTVVTPIVIRRKTVDTGGIVKAMLPMGDDNENGESDVEMEQNDEESGDQGEKVAKANPELLGNRSMFHTFKPEGGLRDVLTIECQKINGEDFKGSITYTEATVKIFQQALELPTDVIHSVKMSFDN